ncbi:hypothetical protein KDW_32460 [Dictyobacter vulcani]|uniref:Uncharacterized protein n=1 Tax=Dictyobacter vulcani TaxID=2607529 RepID=A0A5J4KI06_9CHLR|nr:hypothetical protein KDW_32460 [Dictyobacter vulcani]
MNIAVIGPGLPLKPLWNIYLLSKKGKKCYVVPRWVVPLARVRVYIQSKEMVFIGRSNFMETIDIYANVLLLDC